MDRSVSPARGRAVGLLMVVSLALAGTASYVVRPGDTLSEIALRAGVSTARLQAANDLADPDRIIAGRTLRLGGGSPPTAAGGQIDHVVAPGETVLGLALRYGSTVGAITRANTLSNPNFIRTGERLRIAGGAPAAQPAATGVRAPAAATGARADIGALLESTARRYGMAPAFVKAVAWQESGWNPHVVSSADAVGVMQVLPSTGRFVSASVVGRDLDLTDPADNIEAGVAFLRYVYRLAGGDADMTLAGYYQGLRSVRQNGVYDDTRRYIANVRALRARF